MRNAWALLVVGGMALGLAGGCAHIAATQATFTRTDTALVLQVDRHVEEIVRGPDIEEDQTLVLELRDYQIGKWLAVPSTNATARLEVRRFGAPSHGEVFAGWVKVRKVTATKVVAGTFVDQEFVRQNQFVVQLTVTPASQRLPPLPPRQTRRASETAGGGGGAMPPPR